MTNSFSSGLQSYFGENLTSYNYYSSQNFPTDINFQVIGRKIYHLPQVRYTNGVLTEGYWGIEFGPTFRTNFQGDVWLIILPFTIDYDDDISQNSITYQIDRNLNSGNLNIYSYGLRMN